MVKAYIHRTKRVFPDYWKAFGMLSVGFFSLFLVLSLLIGVSAFPQNPEKSFLWTVVILLIFSIFLMAGLLSVDAVIVEEQIDVDFKKRKKSR